jgi:hypothetical protein
MSYGDYETRQTGDTEEERAAFLKWWEGQAHWSGSACAVAYQGWLAGRAEVSDLQDRLAGDTRVQAQRDELAAENAALRMALERARGCIKGLLARTPVRDVAETLAEIDHALNQTRNARCTPESSVPCAVGGSCPDPNLCANMGDCRDEAEATKRRAYVAGGQSEGKPGGPSRGWHRIKTEGNDILWKCPTCMTEVWCNREPRDTSHAIGCHLYPGISPHAGLHGSEP